MRRIQIEIRDREIAELTRLGLMVAEAKGDRVAIRDALHMFLDTTLQGGV